jgi:predicted O-linked N-acetylglucosamine transferase (SPINDLY family)
MSDLAEANQLLRRGRVEQAEEICRVHLAQNTQDPAAWLLAGLIAIRRRDWTKARERFANAATLDPGLAAAHANLGVVLGMMGRDREAVAALSEAVRLRPQKPEYHDNLGVALERSGRLKDAVENYRQALAIKSNFAAARSHLGNTLRLLGDVESAAIEQRQALLLEPANPEINRQLAGTLWELGDQVQTIACYRRALAGDPKSASTHSNLIYAMLHDAASTPLSIEAETRRWNECFGTPSSGAIGLHARAHSSDRRLRIGYVSPDFAEHPAARVVLPILRHHDRSEFEVFCYSATARNDAMTQQIRGLADGWRDIRTMSDAQAGSLIREDQIDILIDLSGHMAGNRLALFALRPAPVQMTLSYPADTGVGAMDYRITDDYCDPPGETRLHHRERLLRIPCGWIYDPGPLPAIAEPPCLSNGHITFGCLNRPMKITDDALALWSRILRAVPDSRLLQLSGSMDGRNSFLRDRLGRHGLSEQQVELVPRLPRAKFLERFNRIDIALDPFPYNGEATTLDGLWMGVPLVTLKRHSTVSRRGGSHLTTLGLDELIADTPEDYLRIATDLARDNDRLRRLRLNMRNRLGGSILGNAAAYTRQFETALRQVNP